MAVLRGVGISSAQKFQFKNLELYGTLENWNDTTGIRIATHKYLKRNGGECESMGADQRVFQFKCVFIDVGDAVAVTSRYKELVGSILENPRGLLIHPRFGKVQAACNLIQANEDPAKATDAIEFTIHFIEDSLDTKALQQSFGPQVYKNVMLDAIKKLSASNGIDISGTITVLSSQAKFALRDLVNTFINISATFLSLADDAINFVYGVPALLNQLNEVKARGDATIAYAKSLGVPDVVAWPFINEIKIAQASAQDTYNAILADKPPLITFTVPATMSLRTIAVRLYGPDAQSHIQEMLVLNKIQNSAAISVGTILLVSAPTVSSKP